LKARTFILTTCVTFALVAPAAQAASTANMLYRTKVQTVLFDKSHHVAKSSKVGVAKQKSQVRQASSAVAQPAAPGTGVPIEATTSDDYDSTNMTGAPQPSASAPAQGESVETTTPDLIDGYLLINQVN
jgi:hypothetical protein